MASRIASLDPADPDAIEFVRFCYRRRRVGWPELYDEMCAVAARGLYRGMCADDLAGLGIGLSLFDMPALASLASRVTADEQAKRRPVSVAIVAEPSAVPIVAEPTAVPIVPDPVTEGVADPAGEMLVMISEAGVEMAPIPTAAPVAAPLTPVAAPERREERVVEREIDVPIRLAPAPAGA